MARRVGGDIVVTIASRWCGTDGSGVCDLPHLEPDAVEDAVVRYYPGEVQDPDASAALRRGLNTRSNPPPRDRSSAPGWSVSTYVLLGFPNRTNRISRARRYRGDRAATAGRRQSGQ